MLMRLLAAAVLVALTGCSLADGEYFGPVPKPDPTHFRYCNSAEPEHLDPAQANSTTDTKIVYALFDGLTTHDPMGLPMPSLATSWDVSADQRTFTFHLRTDARWSNGRPLTSADLVFSYARALHPLTAGNNAELLWRVRHGRAYTDGVARLVLHDHAPFHAGDVVEVLPGADKQPPPDSNERIARAALSLRGAAQPDAETWAKVPAAAHLTVVELGGAPDARDWAYLHWADGNGGDGVYGWAPLADLDEPHAALEYAVRMLPDRPGADVATLPTGSVPGRELLMIPELLGVRAPDDHTLVLETEGPTPFLIDLTLQKAFRPVPREAVSRWPRSWTRPDRIITSGPFDLTYWRPRDRFELVKAKTFWGRDAVRLERITIYSMNDQAANAAYYYQGGCDATSSNNIPASYFPILEHRKDYHRAPMLGIYFYAINTKKLANVHLRRALSHAIDRSAFPRILKGGQIATEQYTPGTPISELGAEDLALCGVTHDTPGVALIMVKGELCYVPPMGPRFDVAAAQRELAVAKAEMGAAFPKKITVKFNTGVEYHKHIAEYVQAQWKEHLGLEIELESQEWKTYLAATQNHEFEVARFGGIGNFADPEGEFLPDYKCGNPNNRPDWCNPEFDRLYAEAEQEPDRKKRLAIIKRAEQLMVDDAATIPFYVYTQHHLRRPYVRGLAINLPDQPSFRDVWIDPDWRQHAAEAGAK